MTGGTVKLWTVWISRGVASKIWADMGWYRLRIDQPRGHKAYEITLR